MSDTPKIMIIGGTRGLGKVLASEFLDRNCRVFITGREKKAVDAALAELTRGRAKAFIGGGEGDSGSPTDTERLAEEASTFLGGIDHWIQNAGVNQEPGRVWELAADEVERVARIDLLGPLHAAKIAWPHLEASGGFLWMMEGHGSDGRIMSGLSLYGTMKRGVAYLWRALAKEAEGTRVRVGGLSPGIMATDFILQNKEKETPERWARSLKFLNILVDKPETVAAFLAPRILEAKENGQRIAWLTTPIILGRFISAPFVKRTILEP